MDGQFELPVQYKEQELMFKASLLVTGYTHKFNVDVNGQIIVFEPDEERNYRAVIPYDDINQNRVIDIELLKAITTTIHEIIT
jgi:hypothetical protein